MTKKNKILSIILVCLIGIAFLYSGPYKNWKENVNKKKSFFSELNLDTITKFSVDYQGEETILEKQGERFKVAGTKDFYVDKTAQDALLKIITDAKDSELELVSKNKDKREDFGFGEDKVIELKMFENDNLLADVLVGDMTRDYSGSYIAESDSDNIYSVDANLNAVLSRDDWRDYKIITSDKEAINKIRFQYPTREFTIEKDSETGEWSGTLPYTFKVAPEKVDSILDVMTNLQAVSIPEQNFENTGLDKHSIIVQVSGDGIDDTLMIGDADESGNYYAKRGDSDNIYLIVGAERDILNKQIWELK